MKRFLIGCEESQEVCKALRKLGIEAYSCDLLPCSGGHPEWHLQMNVLEALSFMKWDAFIFFPDCTFITVSGLHWNKIVIGRSEKTENALDFICQVYNVAKNKGIEYIGFENPIGCISTRLICNNGFLSKLPNTSKKALKPSQIIQPYNFGENASKSTCLWLYGFPLLTGTGYYPPRITKDGKKRWGNQTDSGQNKLGPSNERKKIRSKTYPGIAKAMANQWGNYVSVL